MFLFIVTSTNRFYISNIFIDPLTVLTSVSVLSLTVTVTTSPSLVWPRRSRCLSTAQWSRMQWTFTTLLMKWPAIPKSGKRDEERSRHLGMHLSGPTMRSWQRLWSHCNPDAGFIIGLGLGFSFNTLRYPLLPWYSSNRRAHIMCKGSHTGL